MSKFYILDTNILMENPNSIFGFEENIVVITDITIDELDNNKNGSGERNRNARIASRTIKKLLTNNKKVEVSNKNTCLKGVEIRNINDGGGKLLIASYEKLKAIAQQERVFPLEMNKEDNKIIWMAKYLEMIFASQEDLSSIILITNDTNMFIKAMIAGVIVQDYKNEREAVNENDKNEFYSGRGKIAINEMNFLTLLTDGEIPIIKKENNGKCISYVGTDESIMFSPEVFVENKYFWVMNLNKKSLSDIKDSCLAIYQNNKLKRILPKTDAVFGVHARNKGQIFALDALTRPVEEIPLVVLKGPAGCAKTFLSLAAGLNDSDLFQKNNDAAYDKVMITRANILSDRDLGALPGDKEEKMRPLVAPALDNLNQLLLQKGESRENICAQIEEWFLSEAIEIESIAYMRGRSIARTYLIVDEAQNCTRNQMLEIITRVAEGTKIVVCGDPDQIDNPKLDKYNNGLTFISERMKGSSLCAQVTFTSDETVRSPLATEAAERLILK